MRHQHSGLVSSIRAFLHPSDKKTRSKRLLGAPDIIKGVIVIGGAGIIELNAGAELGEGTSITFCCKLRLPTMQNCAFQERVLVTAQIARGKSLATSCCKFVIMNLKQVGALATYLATTCVQEVVYLLRATIQHSV